MWLPIWEFSDILTGKIFSTVHVLSLHRSISINSLLTEYPLNSCLPLFHYHHHNLTPSFNEGQISYPSSLHTISHLRTLSFNGNHEVLLHSERLSCRCRWSGKSSVCEPPPCHSPSTHRATANHPLTSQHLSHSNPTTPTMTSTFAPPETPLATADSACTFTYYTQPALTWGPTSSVFLSTTTLAHLIDCQGCSIVQAIYGGHIFVVSATLKTTTYPSPNFTSSGVRY